MATVRPASSPRPSSLDTASSTRPRMKDLPEDGRKVSASVGARDSETYRYRYR